MGFEATCKDSITDDCVTKLRRLEKWFFGEYDEVDKLCDPKYQVADKYCDGQYAKVQKCESGSKQ